MSRTLNVYLHDQIAGQLVQAETGQLTFTYDADYLSVSKQAVSVSMPLREQAYTDDTARPYFSGLLPDERARHRLAAALGTGLCQPGRVRKKCSVGCLVRVSTFCG